MEKICKQHKVFFILIAMLFIIPFKGNSNYLFVSLIILFSITILFKNRFIIKIENSNKIHIKYIPTFLIFIWIYGIINGILNENNLNYIFRNFAGMSIYVLFYMIYIWKIDPYDLINVVVKVSKIILCISFVANIVFWELGLNNSIFLIIKNYTHGFGVNSTAYQVFFLIVYAHILGKFLYKKKITLLEKIYCIVIIYLIFGVYKMGGFILAFIILTLVSIYLKILSRVKISKFSNIIIIYIIFTLTIIFILIDTFIGNQIIFNIFSFEDVGNKVRLEQIKNILDEITFFGKGLGAEFETYIRNSEYAYAIELTYLNLFHKFGFFTFFILYSYIIVFLKAIKITIIYKDIYLSMILIGLINYTIPSIANPYLLSTTNVTLHCIALYVITFTDSYYNLKFKHINTN